MTESDLHRLLRLNPEPYTFHDDAAVGRALLARPRDYLDHLYGALTALSEGRARVEMPSKQVFADPGQRSDFRVMPCVTRFPDRVRKTVKIVGTNWPRKIVPGEISVGQAFALHPAENFIEHGFAACILSSARTGACAAIAMRLLDLPVDHLAVFGAGRVGFFTALYAAALGRTKRIDFCDLDGPRADLAARLVADRWVGLETGVFNASALDRAAESGFCPDALVLATDSERELFDGSGHRPGLVISLGADTDWQREVDADALAHYQLVVDTVDSLKWGDGKRFGAMNLLAQRPVRTFEDLLRDRTGARAPTLVLSTGSALFDNLTIDYLLQGELAATA